MAATDQARAAGDWGPWRYGPLAAIGVLIILVAVALPSSLNLPQANPTETAEYAPVPPSDEDTPPPVGNFSSLGLAGSSSLEGGTGAGGLGPGATTTTAPIVPSGRGGATGTSPQGKRCVGNPPRQTEDPLSPPCAGYFDADNGGATYLGVTESEIRVLWYLDGGGLYLGPGGFEPAPVNTWQDLGEPPPPEGEFVYTRVIRNWQRYFNDRFQTYGRKVHFWVFWTSETENSPEKRRADAADAFARVKPFAILSQARANQDDFLEAMAARGVMNFGSVAGRPESFFAKYPKLIWGYYPSIEKQARQFSTLVCSRVVGHKVSFSGNVEKNGQDRVLGLLYTSDPSRPGYTRFAKLVKRDVEECGGRFKVEHDFPLAGSEFAGNNPPDVIARNMADFQQQGVTTIIWPQGQETAGSGTAQNSGYLPEFVVGGDLTMEGNANAQRQTGQEAWNHAFVMTNLTALDAPSEQQCHLAYKEADPDAGEQDIFHACVLYRDPFQLFVGIQVAGPRLRPESIDTGFRAIPAVASDDPHLPACYYEPGDYTCVKDAQLEWWDSRGRSASSSTPGCWRMVERGKRYRPGEWPSGNLDAHRTPDDPCNNFIGDTHG